MRKSLFILVALFSVLSISAKQITEKEAALIAKNFFNGSSSGHNVKSVKAVTLAHQFKSDGATLMYAFNNDNNGYVLVSGDDATVPVLGYSDNGKFDYNTLPDNARAWFDMYGQLIKSVKEGKVESIQTYASDSSVEPLMVTKWNQGAPYWNLTPQYNGKQTFTGCPATAMAQIAYYHQWPIASNGSVDYVTSSLSIHISSELNTTFDWANMTPTYGENSSESSCTAVAELMREIGYAMEMDYTDNGSGANQIQIACGIVDHLGYDKGLRIKYADTYVTEDWVEMLKEELNSGRPVLYCGYTQMNEGHAFVCDGYNEEGLFHINWGWGGMSDGYFVITSLDPDSQGMGGANSGAGFNKGQLAFFNLQKPVEGSVAIPYTLIYEDGSISVTETSVDLELLNFLNAGYKPFHGDLLCDIITEDNTSVIQIQIMSELELPVFQKYEYAFSIPKDVLLDNLEDGRYGFYFHTVDTNESDVEVEFTCSPFVIVKSGDKIIVENQGGLSPEDYEVIRTSSATNHAEYLFSFDLKNETSETYNGNLMVTYSGVADESGMALTTDTLGETKPVAVTIKPGETKTVNIPSDKMANHMDYTFTLLAEGIEVSDNEFTFSSGSYHPIEFRDAKVHRANDEYVLKTKILNISAEGEVYENIISCPVFTELSFEEVSRTETDTIKLNPNDEVELSIPLVTEGLDFGDYRAMLLYINDGDTIPIEPSEYNAMELVIRNIPVLSADKFSLECEKTGENSSNYTLTYEITNESYFYYEGEFSLKITGAGKEITTPVINVVLAPGKTVAVTHPADHIELLNEHNYKFEIIEQGSASIANNTFEFEVPEEHVLEHRNGSLEIEGDIANFSAQVVNIYECEDDDEVMVYTGPIIIDIYTADGELAMVISTEDVTIESGQAINLQFSFPIHDLQAGTYYIELKCDDDTLIYPSMSPEFCFEIADSSSSISTINPSHANSIVNVVALDGRIIKQGVKASDATQGLAPGVYLIGNKKVLVK